MSGFKPFKVLKDYSKQHPFQFYSILCVVSATAYGEFKFRSMRRKELLMGKNDEPTAKNEYEQYLISQKKKQENQLSLDEERNKLKNIINGTSNIEEKEEKKETILNNTKEKLNQLKNDVISKKEKIENDEKVKNAKKGFTDGIKKLKDNSKKITNKISTEKLTSKIGRKKSDSTKSTPVVADDSTPSNLNDKIENNKVEPKNTNTFFHNGNEKFRDYLQKFNTKKEENTIFNKYNNSTEDKDNSSNYIDDEIYEDNNPERTIFLYDNSKNNY
ncbi:hypothetical protein BCR36DRAFT_579359 [Piromyces finnis]|uniref:Uncharacterized protein n=1 Tax=Piromyces finnis TaxID=1754191 RepID=A0A1Y1VMS5_9FUNG|nr:hypothetical protein BCR36DRAFT_579359 [Piromyces finnis]|eukprot:ORX59911.1 hypothetical protein BCR36DRAFT_579359 [Piromyces finnis]